MFKPSECLLAQQRRFSVRILLGKHQRNPNYIPSANKYFRHSVQWCYKMEPVKEPMRFFSSEDPIVVDNYIIRRVREHLPASLRSLQKRELLNKTISACCNSAESPAFDILKKWLEAKLETFQSGCNFESDVQALDRLFLRYNEAEGYSLAYVARHLTLFPKSNLAQFESDVNTMNCPQMVKEFYDFSLDVDRWKRRGSPVVNLFAALLLARDKRLVFNTIASMLA